MTQKRTNKHYPDQFKEEAVALVREQGYSVPEAAKSLGITPGLLYRWKDKYEAKLEGRALAESEREELTRLRKENRNLLMEREILKKASVDSSGQCNSFTILLICMSTSYETSKTYIHTR